MIFILRARVPCIYISDAKLDRSVYLHDSFFRFAGTGPSRREHHDETACARIRSWRDSPSLTRSVRVARRGNYLTVLCYHRILDLPPDFPFDDDLVSASSKQFDGELDFIARHYRVINFKMLREYMRKDGTLPPRSLIITFDDGYIDNYEVAYPLLKQHGLTAVMFATAGFMGVRRLFWWDRLAYVAKTAKRSSTAIEEPIHLAIDLDSFATRQAAARHLINSMKKLPEQDKELIIRRLAENLGVELDESRFATTMNWNQLREMSGAGIEIGAHSVNHPIFSNIDHETLSREVSGAKQIIEKELGHEVVTFGAPGRGKLPPDQMAVFEKALRTFVTNSGYSFSTMYRWGLVYEREFDPYAIKRVGVERYDSPLLFKAKLASPELLPY